jgi:dihydrofolate reductase
MNTTHKYVVSATLTSLRWGPASLITGDLATAVASLKQQPGKNIRIPGSPTLVRSLLHDRLLDELALLIHPVVLGSGMRLFDELTQQVDLTLIKASTFSTGVLAVTYKPACR